jgi:hypothetical protein
MAMSLKDQLDKATKDLNLAESIVRTREGDTKDTRYGKFDPTSPSGKTALARLEKAAQDRNKAKAYYDGILAAYNKELENKKITGEQEGVSEEVQAAKQGVTVEKLRANKQAALDAEKLARDTANQGAIDQQSVANYSQLINTIAADETQLKSVQEDLRRNFPSLYKGGITGLKDWTATQAALETIAERRGGLPKNLQGASLREFLLKPTIDITTGTAGTGTGVPEPFGTQAIYNKSTTEGLIDSIFSSLGLGREANQAEIDQLFKELQAEQKKLSSISKGTYKMVNGRQVLVQESGLDPRTFLENRVKQLDVYKTSQAAKTEKSKQTLASTALANGYDLETDFAMDLPNWLESINNGESIDKFKTAIRTSARRILPESVRSQIAPDEDLSTTFSTYMSNIARARGLPISAIKLNDVIPLAITDKGFADTKQFEVNKRSQAWWDGSPEGISVTTTFLNDTLKDFGLLGQGVRTV